VDIFDLVDPAELTGFARQALADRPVNQFRLSSILPDETIDDLVYRFTTGGGGLTQAAGFRTWDAEPGFGKRRGVSRVTGELPPIAHQMFLDEYTQMRSRNNTDAMINAIFDDAATLVRQIDARFELARADALVNGSVTLAENGVEASVSFGRKSEHQRTAGTAWSTTTADIIGDIEDAIAVYVDTNGVAPGMFLTTAKVLQAMKRNEGMLKLAYPTIADTTGLRLQSNDVNQIFADEGWPAIQTYDANVLGVDGVQRRILPEGVFLMLPTPGGGADGSQRMGATLWGTTLEAAEPEYGVEAGDMPGLVVASFKQKTTPVQVVTIASAIGIPILGDPNLSLRLSTGVS
jgi:hypothetical protein